MGKLFTTNTWRAPLQLIECWLPSPALRTARAANEPIATRAMERFAKAGWLKRGAADVPASTGLRAVSQSEHVGARVRVLRRTEPAAAATRAGVKLVISGRINDVCAELDRLADQERQLAARAA